MSLPTFIIYCSTNNPGANGWDRASSELCHERWGWHPQRSPRIMHSDCSWYWIQQYRWCYLCQWKSLTSVGQALRHDDSDSKSIAYLCLRYHVFVIESTSPIVFFSNCLFRSGVTRSFVNLVFGGVNIKVSDNMNVFEKVVELWNFKFRNISINITSVNIHLTFSLQVATGSCARRRLCEGRVFRIFDFCLRISFSILIWPVNSP